MERRTVADQIAGLDEVLVAAAGTSAMAAPWQMVRVAVAEAVRRHNELFARLERGEDPCWLVADGVVAWWGDSIELDGGWPLRGAEIEPVAAAVLDQLGPAEVLDALVLTRPAVSRLTEHGEPFPAAVVLEWFDGFALAALAAG